MGGVGVNEYLISVHTCTHVCTGMGGAYGCLWASDGVRVTNTNHVHAHLVGLGGVGWVSVLRWRSE